MTSNNYRTRTIITHCFYLFKTLIEIDLFSKTSRFLADKAAIVVATSPLPPPLSNSQNLAKDQALTALPPVAALKITLSYPVKGVDHIQWRFVLKIGCDDTLIYLINTQIYSVSTVTFFIYYMKSQLTAF